MGDRFLDTLFYFMKDTFYFPHDYNARSDQKILVLRGECGNEGYAFYFMCLEVMAEDSNGYLYRSAIAGLSQSFGSINGALEKVIECCLKTELFKEEDGKLYSTRMMEYKAFRKERSESGKRGARKRWLSYSSANAESNANKRKGKEINNIYSASFDDIWIKYPKRIGRKAAERHFVASVKTDKDWSDINKALDNYLKSDTVLRGYIQNGATWFNNWRDWIDSPTKEGRKWKPFPTLQKSSNTSESKA